MKPNNLKKRVPSNISNTHDNDNDYLIAIEVDDAVPAEDQVDLEVPGYNESLGNEAEVRSRTEDPITGDQIITADLLIRHNGVSIRVINARLIKDKTTGNMKNKTIKIIFIGRIGAGKSTLFGCVRRDYKTPVLGLDSSTRSVICETFAFDEIVEIDGKETIISIIAFDTPGLLGNPETDIFILNDILNTIAKETPNINAIYFCISANRSTESDKAIMKLIAEHGGEEILSHMKFILTHAPEALVTDIIINQVIKAVSENMKREITRDDIIPINLIDPNQFHRESTQYTETIDYWNSQQDILHKKIIESSLENPFKLKPFTDWRKFLSLLSVFRRKIVIGLLILTVVILLISMFYHMLKLQKMTAEAIDSHNKIAELITASEECKASLMSYSNATLIRPEESLPGKILKGAMSSFEGMKTIGIKGAMLSFEGMKAIGAIGVSIFF